MTDPCVLVVHEGSPLAGRDRCPTLEEIAELPLAYPSGRMGEGIRKHFRAAGVDPPRTFALQSNAAVQALARAGVAAAIMPRLAVDPDLIGTTTVDLTAILPPRTLVLYWHRDRVHGPALKTFVDVTRVVCDQLAVPSARGRPRHGAIEHACRAVRNGRTMASHASGRDPVIGGDAGSDVACIVADSESISHR